ncbi:hypothetical protein [Mycoplasmopsis bovis]|uniref:hypothetical protein n=1 Tax=Mycoplasmopsis bovis TaxID=28903 RepID=UPI00240CF1D0|nr:hypothetical protein [Mycoplasmopsis bovis]
MNKVNRKFLTAMGGNYNFPINIKALKVTLLPMLNNAIVTLIIYKRSQALGLKVIASMVADAQNELDQIEKRANRLVNNYLLTL